MNIIRFVLGKIILFFDWLTSPKPLNFSSEKLEFIQNKVKKMEIYEFRACPFCVKVRRFMKKNNIIIKVKDARRNKDFANELINGGGKLQVPCLRFNNDENKWLYESNDIINFFIDYLELNDEQKR